MNTKRHRVPNESPFPGTTHALQDRAVQCAENEGWPIPCDPPEPLLVVAQATFVQHAAARVSEHAGDEFHFRSGRSRVAPPARRVVAVMRNGACRPHGHERHLAGHFIARG